MDVLFKYGNIRRSLLCSDHVNERRLKLQIMSRGFNKRVRQKKDIDSLRNEVLRLLNDIKNDTYGIISYSNKYITNIVNIINDNEIKIYWFNLIS